MSKKTLDDYGSLGPRKKAPRSRRRQSPSVHQRELKRREVRKSNPYRSRYKTRRWKGLRLLVLKRDAYICQGQGCGKTVGDKPNSAHVDHIKRADLYPDLFWTMSNLQTLCTTCHQRKTNRGE